MIRIAMITGMGVALGAAVPPETADPTMWAQWGLAGLVVGYTLWRDAQRERRMALSHDAQQRWIQNTLLAAMEQNTAALERLAAIKRACDDHAA